VAALALFCRKNCFGYACYQKVVILVRNELFLPKLWHFVITFEPKMPEGPPKARTQIIA